VWRVPSLLWPSFVPSFCRLATWSASSHTYGLSWLSLPIFAPPRLLSQSLLHRAFSRPRLLAFCETPKRLLRVAAIWLPRTAHRRSTLTSPVFRGCATRGRVILVHESRSFSPPVSSSVCLPFPRPRPTRSAVRPECERLGAPSRYSTQRRQNFSSRPDSSHRVLDPIC